MSYVLGLTGSIGMGKSTTAGMFRDAGVPVWDADAVVHRLYAPGGAGVKPIRTLHPEAVSEDQVDRAALKAWISSDATALSQIEAAIHPLVAEDRANFLENHADDPLVVLDIPLLFEGRAMPDLDGVLVVTAPPEDQRRRVLERGTMTEAMFEAILARQVPDAEKRAKADFVIETRSLEQTRKDVETLVRSLKDKSNA